MVERESGVHATKTLRGDVVHLEGTPEARDSVYRDGAWSLHYVDLAAALAQGGHRLDPRSKRTKHLVN